MDSRTTVQQLKDRVTKFCRNRDWTNLGLRSLAISIVLEAAELLERFQWDDYKTQKKSNRGELKEELADIIYFCLAFASEAKIDIDQALKSKIKKLTRKYPAKLFRKAKSGAQDYWRIKKQYRQKGGRS